MDKMRLRVANGVDTGRLFSASIRGGERGFVDCMALETFSNDVFPCVKCLGSFCVVAEPCFPVLGVSESFGRVREWLNGARVNWEVSPALRAGDCKLPKYVWIEEI